MRRHRGIAALGALLVGAATTDGATLHVPSEYPTIQAGIDGASAGDTVLVAPGLYIDYETRGSANSSVFMKDGVALVSEGGSSVTEIHMPISAGDCSIILASDMPSVTTAVEGFTLTSVPLYESAAWLHELGRVTFRDCVFRDLVGYVTNAGLNVNNGDVDFGCRFVNRQTTGTSLGAGIYHDDGRIGYATRTSRTATARHLRRRRRHREQAIIENCQFVNCQAPRAGGQHRRRRGTTIRGCFFGATQMTTREEGGSH